MAHNSRDPEHGLDGAPMPVRGPGPRRGRTAGWASPDAPRLPAQQPLILAGPHSLEDQNGPEPTGPGLRWGCREE